MFYIFFLENFIDGIIPPITPLKPLYKGGYGRGEGVYTPYRGVYGGVLTIILGVPLPYAMIILTSHGTTHHHKDNDTYYKEEEGFKWIVHIVRVFNYDTNIWQHIHTAKKKGNYCSPSIVSDSIMKSSSSVGPLSVSEGEELQLPHCSHLHIVL